MKCIVKNTSNLSICYVALIIMYNTFDILVVMSVGK